MNSNDEKLAMKIVAVCWEQFGRGANITIHDSAYDRAFEIALPNLRTRLSQQAPFSDSELKDAKWCSNKAGKRARRIASSPEFMSDVVTDEIFQKAFDDVSDFVNKWNEKRDKKDQARIEGVFC